MSETLSGSRQKPGFMLDGFTSSSSEDGGEAECDMEDESSKQAPTRRRRKSPRESSTTCAMKGIVIERPNNNNNNKNNNINNNRRGRPNSSNNIAAGGDPADTTNNTTKKKKKVTDKKRMVRAYGGGGISNKTTTISSLVSTARIAQLQHSPNTSTTSRLCGGKRSSAKSKIPSSSSKRLKSSHEHHQQQQHHQQQLSPQHLHVVAGNSSSVVAGSSSNPLDPVHASMSMPAHLERSSGRWLDRGSSGVARLPSSAGRAAALLLHHHHQQKPHSSFSHHHNHGPNHGSNATTNNNNSPNIEASEGDYTTASNTTRHNMTTTTNNDTTINTGTVTTGTTDITSNVHLKKPAVVTTQSILCDDEMDFSYSYSHATTSNGNTASMDCDAQQQQQLHRYSQQPYSHHHVPQQLQHHHRRQNHHHQPLEEAAAAAEEEEEMLNNYCHRTFQVHPTAPFLALIEGIQPIPVESSTTSEEVAAPPPPPGGGAPTAASAAPSSFLGHRKRKQHHPQQQQQQRLQQENTPSSASPVRIGLGRMMELPCEAQLGLWTAHIYHANNTGSSSSHKRHNHNHHHHTKKHNRHAIQSSPPQTDEDGASVSRILFRHESVTALLEGPLQHYHDSADGTTTLNSTRIMMRRPSTKGRRNSKTKTNSSGGIGQDQEEEEYQDEAQVQSSSFSSSSSFSQQQHSYQQLRQLNQQELQEQELFFQNLTVASFHPTWNRVPFVINPEEEAYAANRETVISSLNLVGFDGFTSTSEMNARAAQVSAELLEHMEPPPPSAISHHYNHHLHSSKHNRNPQSGDDNVASGTATNNRNGATTTTREEVVLETPLGGNARGPTVEVKPNDPFMATPNTPHHQDEVEGVADKIDEDASPNDDDGDEEDLRDGCCEYSLLSIWGEPASSPSAAASTPPLNNQRSTIGVSVLCTTANSSHANPAGLPLDTDYQVWMAQDQTQVHSPIVAVDIVLPRMNTETTTTKTTVTNPSVQDVGDPSKEDDDDDDKIDDDRDTSFHQLTEERLREHNTRFVSRRRYDPMQRLWTYYYYDHNSPVAAPGFCKKSTKQQQQRLPFKDKGLITTPKTIELETKRRLPALGCSPKKSKEAPPCAATRTSLLAAKRKAAILDFSSPLGTKGKPNKFPSTLAPNPFKKAKHQKDTASNATSTTPTVTNTATVSAAEVKPRVGNSQNGKSRGSSTNVILRRPKHDNAPTSLKTGPVPSAKKAKQHTPPPGKTFAHVSTSNTNSTTTTTNTVIQDNSSTPAAGNAIGPSCYNQEPPSLVTPHVSGITLLEAEARSHVNENGTITPSGQQLKQRQAEDVKESIVLPVIVGRDENQQEATTPAQKLLADPCKDSSYSDPMDDLPCGLDHADFAMDKNLDNHHRIDHVKNPNPIFSVPTHQCEIQEHPPLQQNGGPASPKTTTHCLQRRSFKGYRRRAISFMFGLILTWLCHTPSMCHTNNTTLDVCHRPGNTPLVWSKSTPLVANLIRQKETSSPMEVEEATANSYSILGMKESPNASVSRSVRASCPKCFGRGRRTTGFWA